MGNTSQFGDKTKELAEQGNRRAQEAMGMLAQAGISTDQMVDRLYEGIKREIFYIVGYDKWSEVQDVGAMWLRRAEDLMLGRAPSFLDIGVAERAKAGDPETQAQSKQTLAKGRWVGMDGWGGSKL